MEYIIDDSYKMVKNYTDKLSIITEVRKRDFSNFYFKQPTTIYFYMCIGNRSKEESGAIFYRRE